MNGQQIELTLLAAGERLDKALADILPDISRTQWQRLIKTGQVLVQGELAKASLRLEGGESAVVTLPPPLETELRPEAIPLDIRYEDEDCLLVNKPAGMVVHPSIGHESGTLANAVLAYCPGVMEVGGEKRPGIVHRLDKDSSGLILVAKNDRSLRHLQAQFKERTVRKVYLALVEGRIQPAEAIIDAPIGRDPRQRKKMTVISKRSARSRPSQTSYSTAITFEDHTLVECIPRTGRTHQIRVHLAHIGFPIVGDVVYGRRKQRIAINRHFLHASQLTFLRPSDETPLTFEAALPQELQAIVDQLSTTARV
jgi:23S rRNA pseudouridine1911/1915/1917 synthase